MTDSESQSNVRRLAVFGGLALLAAYAWSTYAPPPRLKYVSPTEASTILSRMFPGIDTSWIVARLAALASGIALVLWGLPQTRRVTPAEAEVQAVPTAAAYLALGCACLHLAALPWIGVLTTLGQGIFILGLMAPAAIVAAATRRPGSSALRRLLPAFAVIAGWYCLRLYASADDPRLASAVDLWRTFAALHRFATTDMNLLTDPFDEEIPGVPATPLFFSGVSVLQLLDQAPTVAWSQTASATWLAIAAAAVASVCAQLVGAAVAPVAAATMLFSPFILMMQLVPDSGFIGPTLTSFLVFFGARLLTRPSAVGLLALAPLMGLVLPYPAMFGVVALLGVVALRRITLSWREFGWPVVLTACLSFLTIALPSLPSPASVATMFERYVGRGLESGVLQESVLHQKPLDHTKLAWGSARIGPLDVPVGAALTPFVVSRTDMRLMGDALFEPMSAAFAAIGLGLCLRRPRSAPLVFAALLLVVTIAPGSLTNMDRTSFLRMFGAPIAMALLSAIGFAALRQRLSSRLRAPATVVACLAIAGSGVLIFDHVNPSITRRSAIGLVFEALEPSERARAVFLVEQPPGKEDWTFSDLIATNIGPTPLAVVDLVAHPEWVELPNSLLAGNRDLLFWTRPVEGLRRMSRRVCQRWPEAVIYAIRDVPGLSLVIAARPAGPGWQPALPESQWQAEPCAEISSTHLPNPS